MHSRMLNTGKANVKLGKRLAGLLRAFPVWGSFQALWKYLGGMRHLNTLAAAPTPTPGTRVHTLFGFSPSGFLNKLQMQAGRPEALTALLQVLSQWCAKGHWHQGLRCMTTAGLHARGQITSHHGTA